MTDHVTNKKLSKNLKEAGFPQESEFYWSQRTKYSKCKLSSKKELNFDIGCLSQRPYVYYSAYLATELLKWLKIRYEISCKNSRYCILINKYNNEHAEYADILQDALGEMLLYLKKKGLM